MLDKMKYDVIVIGAGPAGSMSAYHLAKAGKNVLVLEKQQLPRVKACAGGLTLKAQQAIPFDISPVVDVEAKGGILTFHGKPVLKVALEQPLANLVNRDEFDQFLLTQAIKSGAKVMAGTKVTGFIQDNSGVSMQTEQGIFQANYLVGADGVNSMTARILGLLLNREVGYAIEAELQVPLEALHAHGAYVTFDFGALKNGYGWIFPKKDHLSVGVCYAQTAKQPGLRDKLDEFIRSQKVLQSSEILSIKGHHVPLGGIISDLHKGRCLLVGDAANLADAWMGEGLYYAILSAKLAADSILIAMQTNSTDLSDYSDEVNTRITTQLYYARKMARLIYGLPRLALKLIRRNQEVMDLTFGVIRGNISFQACYQQLKNRWGKILRDSFIKAPNKERDSNDHIT